MSFKASDKAIKMGLGEKKGNISLASDIREIFSLQKQCVEHEMTIKNLQEEKENMKEFYKEKIMKLETEISDLKKNSGISLRDHFAGFALQGLLSSDFKMTIDPITFSEMAYEQADAMIAERNKYHKERHETFGEDISDA